MLTPPKFIVSNLHVLQLIVISSFHLSPFLRTFVTGSWRTDTFVQMIIMSYIYTSKVENVIFGLIRDINTVVNFYHFLAVVRRLCLHALRCSRCLFWVTSVVIFS